MATLHAAFKLRGNLGNLSYYTDRNGRNIVRSKGGPSKKAVLKHRNFERTRESCADFGAASSVAAVVRRAFLPYLKWTSESDYFNRLVGLVRMIQRTDQTNIRGTKNILSGNVYMLEDFEFNANRHLANTLDAEITPYVDKATGNTIVSFSSFTPATHLAAPKGATHFQLIAQAVTLDTEEERSARTTQIGPLLDINSTETGIIELDLQLNTQEEGILAVAAGILFYKEEMEIPLSIRDGALKIISIDRISPANTEQPPQTAVIARSESSPPPVIARSESSSDEATSRNTEETQPPRQQSASGDSPAAASAKAGQRHDQPLDIFLSGMVPEHLPRNLSESQQAFYHEKLQKLQLSRWQNKLNKYRKG
jgi:hypothetical protein